MNTEAADGRAGMRALIEAFQEAPGGTDIEIRRAHDLSGAPALGVTIGDKWFAFHFDDARAIAHGITEMVKEFPDQAKTYGPLAAAITDALAIMEGPLQ